MKRLFIISLFLLLTSAGIYVWTYSFKIALVEAYVPLTEIKERVSIPSEEGVFQRAEFALDYAKMPVDEKELAIGAGNGSKLTTDPNMEVHPVTGKPMRKVKIVDIRTTNEAVDPYGNTHQIPHTSDIKINTQHKRFLTSTTKVNRTRKIFSL